MAREQARDQALNPAPADRVDAARVDAALVGAFVDSVNIDDQQPVSVPTNGGSGPPIVVPLQRVFMLSTPGTQPMRHSFDVLHMCTPDGSGGCASGLGRAYTNRADSPEAIHNPAWPAPQPGDPPYEPLSGIGWQVQVGHAYFRGWRPMLRTRRTTTVAPGSELIAQIDGDIDRIYYIDDTIGPTPDDCCIYVMLFINETNQQLSTTAPIKLRKGEFVEVFKQPDGSIIAGPVTPYVTDPERCTYVKNVRGADLTEAFLQIGSQKQIDPASDVIPNECAGPLK